MKYYLILLLYVSSKLLRGCKEEIYKKVVPEMVKTQYQNVGSLGVTRIFKMETLNSNTVFPHNFILGHCWSDNTREECDTMIKL